MQLSVAICTHNPDDELLARVLDAIVDEMPSVASVEVVIIDNNSRAPLSERSCLREYPIRIVSEDTPGLTAAREAAIQTAQGDLILFVDDDNVLNQGYLANVVREFDVNPELAVLGGTIVPEFETQPPAWFGDFDLWLAVRRYETAERHETSSLSGGHEHWPVGAGMAIRRSLGMAYVRDTLTSARIEGRRGSSLSSGEDLDLVIFALSGGHTVAVTGALTLVHVLSAERLTKEYLGRLVVGNASTVLALDRKWEPRLGRSIFRETRLPVWRLAGRALLMALFGLWSPRHWVMARYYRTLTRARFWPVHL